MWTDNRDRYSHSLSDSVGFQNSAADLHTALFPSLTNNNCENNMKDLQPLQGLRAVCAMAIVLGHQNEFFLTPMIGVEYLQAVNIFFLLSGLPLARLYTHRRNNPNNDTTTITNGDGTGTTNTRWVQVKMKTSPWKHGLAASDSGENEPLASYPFTICP